ncbi:MAG: hypothetical protein H7326_02480 [Bdellovibrionaceae bacterium]|nr:hypothetical protein [Pseudobdellovibrionaceae bacterium]
MSQFLYHFMPKSLRGDILFPLNDLKLDQPAICAEQAKKYDGREHLLQKSDPELFQRYLVNGDADDKHWIVLCRKNNRRPRNHSPQVDIATQKSC